jgi:hypothetical protein
LTLADATGSDAVEAGLLCAAALLGKRPRCKATTADRHREAVRERYGLAIDDLSLRRAVAIGGTLHLEAQDDDRTRRLTALLQWWERSYRDMYDLLLTDGPSSSGDLIFDGLLAAYIALTRRVAAYARHLPLIRGDEPVLRVAKAVAARAVADVLRASRGGPRDWQTVVRILEYYGWECGSGSLSRKADALRKLVERRTRVRLEGASASAVTSPLSSPHDDGGTRRRTSIAPAVPG